MQYSELEKILLAYPNKNWNFKSLSMNPNISLKFIELYPQFNWYYHYISLHPKLNIAFIEKYKDKQWNWTNIASNKYIPINYIINKINPKYWRMSAISSNYTITTEFIKQNLHIDWHWNNLTLNPKISITDIKLNLQLPWRIDFQTHSILWPYCEYLKIKNINEYINLYKNKQSIEVPYNLEELYFENDRFDTYIINQLGELTLDIIQENCNFPWDFIIISENQFDYNYKQFKINKIKNWYKKLKLSKKILSIVEIAVMVQMRPDGKYMQNFLKTLDD